MNTVRVLAVLALSALPISVTAPGEARPRAATTMPSVGAAVDVSHLRKLGVGAPADLIQRVIASEFQGYAGGRIVIRVTGLSLNSYVGSNGGNSGGGGEKGGGGSFDYLEGDLLILGPRGEVLAQHHQVSSSPASSGGAYYLPGAEQRRIEALARTFAGWLKRYTM